MSTPGEILNADCYVFASGPWLGKVFPFLAPTITPTRQEVFFFGTAAAIPLHRRATADLD